MREPVSVCLALYNGEKYITEQIDSILSQLDHIEDELIIIDDCSSDSSVEIINSYNSSYIHLYQNDRNIGYIKTFEKAICISKNSVVFLSDHDDIWVEGRLNKMYDKLQEADNWLVCSNFETFNNKGESVVRFKTKLIQSKPEKFTRNILSIFKGNIAYFGCTMAFRKELKNYIIPFPDYIDAHDLWISMTGNVLKKVVHLEDITILHRIHDNNTSFVQRDFYKKMYTRFLFLKTLIDAYKRKRMNNLQIKKK